MVVDSQSTGSSQERFSISGVRLTQGNAVDCPQIRADDGVIHTVSYLTPGVEIGARVKVTGYLAVTTKCLGTVLFVEEEQSPPH